jgi:hypothetical protein
LPLLFEPKRHCRTTQRLVATKEPHPVDELSLSFVRTPLVSSNERRFQAIEPHLQTNERRSRANGRRRSTSKRHPVTNVMLSPTSKALSSKTMSRLDGLRGLRVSSDAMSSQSLAEAAIQGMPLQSAPELLDDLLLRPAGALHLWAPATVGLDERTSLQVVVGITGTVAELARFAFLERAFVVAVDLATGTPHTARLAGGGGLTRLAPTPGFEGGLGTTTGAHCAQVARCPLWDATVPAWPPGRYRLTAVAADRVSNDAIVEVARSMSTIDPAVLQAEAASSMPSVWPHPDPEGGLPRYAAHDWSLPLPADPGVHLHAERVVRAGPGDAVQLEGAVRARALDAYRVLFGALVPVTLVITGSEAPGPLVVPMRVPSFDRRVASGEAGLTARFAVDLLRLAPLAAAQTYFVHAFTADAHGGPQAIAVREA